jgi:hypothetical protein
MSVEITVEPAPTTPEITVNPAGEVTCTVTYSTLTGSINNPGGSNGDVQVKNGVGFAGISPGTAGQVLTSTGTAWESAPPDGIPDGDKGDITVSGGGAIWTIDNGAVTLAKQANMATASVVYRKTAGSGVPEVNTLATLKTDLGLTGTNTGDQTITLTGDVTGSGTGSFAATIANSAVTAAKMATTLDLSSKTLTLPAAFNADTPSDFFQINDGGGGEMVRIGIDSGLNGQIGLWDSTNGGWVYATGADVGWILGGEFTATIFNGSGAALTSLNASNIALGTLALARGGTGASLTDPNADRLLFWDDSAGQVTWLEAGSGLTISGTTISASGGVTDGDKGDITVSSSGAVWTIDHQAVTFAKMQHISTAHLLGRHSSGSGDVQQITIDGGLELQGANLRRAALTGDVTASAGSNSTTIANDAVTYAKMQNISAASRLLGRGASGGAGDTQEISIGSGLAISGTTLAVSGYNPFDQNLNTTDAVAFAGLDLTSGDITSVSGRLAYNYYDVVDSSAVPFISVGLYDDQDPPASIGAALFGFRGNGAGSGTQIFQGSTNNFQFEGVGGANTADVYAYRFLGDGASLTSLNAGNISSGTLGVANGGTGATTLTANAVLLGNGTSAPLEVAPSTSGNVLTSNGTTWTSTAPATTNPAGSGSELQFRSSGTAFGAVTNSSVSSGAITLGDAESLGTTPTALLTLRNTSAAAAGAQQVSPSIVLEGQGWKTTATAASQTVRFRQNVLPVQGTTNPSGTWRLQSEINNSGTWVDSILAQPGGVLYLGSGAGSLQLGTSLNGTAIGIHSAGVLFSVSSAFSTKITTTEFRLPANQALVWTGTDNNAYTGTTEVSLIRDANGVLAQRNSSNAQTFRIYETDSGANDEYLELSAAAGTNLIRPQATGTGTASVVRYHTTTTVFWTSGSGSPESVVTAPVGSMYTRTDGGAGTTLYVKESGTGSTGWVAK